MFATLPERLGPRHRVAVWVVAAVCLVVSSARAADAKRVVSLNPSLTAILIAIGARDALVGVDDYSADLSHEVADLPRVGGLFSPSLEAVVALAPDVVVVVPSAEQRDFRARLAALGVEVAVFDNIRLDQVLENIERLGVMVDREGAARERIEAIKRAYQGARVATADLAPVRTLLVVQRDPIYVVGRGGFIGEILEAAGGENLAREFDDPYPRVAVEWVVARAPDVIIDLSPNAVGAIAYWSRWPSIPAVRLERVVPIDAALISMPGPKLDRAIELLGRALHGDGVGNKIEDAISGAGKR